MLLAPPKELRDRLDPAEWREVEHTADRQMARSTLPRIAVYPIATLGMGWAADFGAHHPWLWGLILTLATAAAAWRLVVVLRFDSLYERDRGRWRWQFLISLGINMGLWAVLVSAIFLDS